MDKMKYDYSNRTLAYLVLVALVVAVIGSFITLSRISSFGVPLITGAASSGTGTTQVVIGSTLSIILIDSAINYGTCRPGVANTSVFESNNTRINGSGDSQCSGMTDPQNITVENYGNIGANVTIQTNTVDLTGGTGNKSLFFSWRNATNSPGCYKAVSGFSLQEVWHNFTATGIENVSCQNLSYGPNNKRLWYYLRVWMPSDAGVGARTATLTFTARNSYGI